MICGLPYNFKFAFICQNVLISNFDSFRFRFRFIEHCSQTLWLLMLIFSSSYEPKWCAPMEMNMLIFDLSSVWVFMMWLQWRLLFIGCDSFMSEGYRGFVSCDIWHFDLKSAWVTWDIGILMSVFGLSRVHCNRHGVVLRANTDIYHIYSRISRSAYKQLSLIHIWRCRRRG